MTDPGQSILLCIGGGIAAYKSAFLCSRLVQAGYDLRVAMSESALHFVGTATFAALSGKAVAQDTFQSDQRPLGGHIELAGGIDLMVIAPATANLLGKFAGGIADDLISTLYLQAECPVLVAPAMSHSMWSKAAVQRNMETLRGDGCHVIGPDAGWLSCRVKGEGRMSEPDAIAKAIGDLLGNDE